MCVWVCVSVFVRWCMQPTLEQNNMPSMETETVPLFGGDKAKKKKNILPQRASFLASELVVVVVVWNSGVRMNGDRQKDAVLTKHIIVSQYTATITATKIRNEKSFCEFYSSSSSPLLPSPSPATTARTNEMLGMIMTIPKLLLLLLSVSPHKAHVSLDGQFTN